MIRRIVLQAVCLGLFFQLMTGTGVCAERLRLGIRAISPPFSFLSKRDGKSVVRGFFVDQMMLIGRLLGKDVDFLAMDSLEKRSRALDDGLADIEVGSEGFAMLADGLFVPAGMNMHIHLYVNSSCRSVTCQRDLESKKVVVMGRHSYAPGFDLGSNVFTLDSPLEALNLVSQGTMDVFVAHSSQVADYLIDKYQIPNILKKGVVLGETRIGYVVSKDRPQLAEALRHAIARLDQTGVNTKLEGKWFGKTSLSTDLKEYAKYVAIALALLAIGLLLVVAWNFSLKKRVGQIAMDLRRSEQRYRDLIESSPDMIFLVNEDGHILHANERARTSLPFPEGGEPDIQQLVTSEYEEEVTIFLKKIFYDGCDKCELSMGLASNPMEVEVAGRLLQGPLRTEMLACLFARNVTERNRMEEELIQSERLGIIGKMAASLAHEINNPLGVIQANAEDLMFEENLTPEVKSGLLAVQRNAIRAGEITKGLLEAATPKPMSMDIIEVGDLVRDALSLLGNRKRERVEQELPGEPLFIRGDERALQQVLMNLVFNSLAVTGQGERILIRAKKAGQGEDATVRLEVSDNGTGIERHNLTRIFEPFFSSRKGGFGLGLFITRRMVERHDGLIFAESEPGKGTCMYLEFPSVRPEEA